jgi:hypothetical protein
MLTSKLNICIYAMCIHSAIASVQIYLQVYLYTTNDYYICIYTHILYEAQQTNSKVQRAALLVPPMPKRAPPEAHDDETPRTRLKTKQGSGAPKTPRTPRTPKTPRKAATGQSAMPPPAVPQKPPAAKSQPPAAAIQEIVAPAAKASEPAKSSKDQLVLTLRITPQRSRSCGDKPEEWAKLDDDSEERH